MNQEQLIRAMSALGFIQDEDYTIESDYESIAMINIEMEKPSEESLQQMWDDIQTEEEKQARIAALGDMALLIGKYLVANAEDVSENDCFNLAGFAHNTIESEFGWSFANLSKPTLEQLETLKETMDEEAVDASREAKLNEIRAIREPKLDRVDQLVNIAYLNTWSPAERTEIKDYRQALLDITEAYKDDMQLLDSVIVAELEWPEEPSE